MLLGDEVIGLYHVVLSHLHLNVYKYMPGWPMKPVHEGLVKPALIWKNLSPALVCDRLVYELKDSVGSVVGMFVGYRCR